MDFFDLHDYFNEIDEDYLTPKQFLDFNYLLSMHKNELTDNEIWSMVYSNDIIKEHK